MAVIRINKNQNYTTMSNYHFREKDMSLKAKGLLSLMLSLPDNWNYSVSGLVSICKENETAIKNTLIELQKFGYLKITKLMPCKEENRSRIEYIYDVFENPQEGKKQGLENLPLDNKTQEKCGDSNHSKNPQEGKKQGLETLPLDHQPLENHGQLNTNKVNIKELNTKKNIYDENFEKLWKMLPPRPGDRKDKVSKERKKELYDMGIDKIQKTIETYLQKINPKYHYNRDNFFNHAIDYFLYCPDIDVIGDYGSLTSYDIDEFEKHKFELF